MITKNDLKNYISNQKHIDIQKEQIDILKYHIGSKNLDGMPKGKGLKESYKLEELIDEEKELEKEHEDLKLKLVRIQRILNKVSPSNRRILDEVYIKGIQRSDIAYDRNVSEDRINHMIGYALSEFEQKILESGVNNIK